MKEKEEKREIERKGLKHQTKIMLLLCIIALLEGIYDFSKSLIKIGELETIHRQALCGKGLIAILLAFVIGKIAYNIKHGKIYTYKNADYIFYAAFLVFVDNEITEHLLDIDTGIVPTLTWIFLLYISYIFKIGVHMKEDEDLTI
jgi:hypothetical protein